MGIALGHLAQYEPPGSDRARVAVRCLAHHMGVHTVHRPYTRVRGIALGHLAQYEPPGSDPARVAVSPACK